MVTSPLIVGHHTRPSHPFSPIPCSPNPLFFNSFPLISFADRHHLNPVASCLYKNHRGEGVPNPRICQTHENPLLSPVIDTDPKSSSRKSFPCNRSVALGGALPPFGTITRQSAVCCIIPRCRRLG